MYLAMLQLNSVTGDICGNAARIAHAARMAATSGANLCITSNHALCGAGPQHMLMVDGFVEACQNALHALANEFSDGPPLLLGIPLATVMPDDAWNRNAAVLLKDGKIVVAASMTLHPDVQANPCMVQSLCCGMVTLSGWRIGVLLCDAQWENVLFGEIQKSSGYDDLQTMLMTGLDALVHLGATPFTMGMHELREQWLSHAASLHHLHLFSSNLVGGNGCDIYHGQSLAFAPTGALISRGKAFEEDCVLINCSMKSDSPSAKQVAGEKWIWDALCLGLRDYVRKSGFERVLLGLSGGLDSAVTAAIAVDALGKGNVLGVLLPSPWTSVESMLYARNLAENLDIKLVELSIAPLMQSYADTLAPAFASLPFSTHADKNFTEENIQSRIRGSLLMALANKYGLLLLNTSNKSEIAVGYSTLYGDAAGALAVIGDVYKSGVYKLARWYNVRKGSAGIPEGIIRRAPSAELRPGQIDTDSLPPYDELDPMLALIMKEKSWPEFTTNAPGQQYPALFNEVYGKMCSAEFKRRQFPPALRISCRSLGQDWRLPLVSRYGAVKNKA